MFRTNGDILRELTDEEQAKWPLAASLESTTATNITEWLSQLPDDVLEVCAAYAIKSPDEKEQDLTTGDEFIACIFLLNAKHKAKSMTAYKVACNSGYLFAYIIMERMRRIGVVKIGRIQRAWDITSELEIEYLISAEQMQEFVDYNENIK